LNIKSVFFVYVGLFSIALTHASPTSSDFTRCNKKAVAIIEICLRHNEDNCWLRSEMDYKSCRKDVIRSHQYYHNRKKAAKIQRDIQDAKNMSTNGE